jgi:tRNA-dihydrouridine synthase
VLVARGACGNPWIFRELEAAERGLPPSGPPDREEWVAVVLRHVDLQIEHRARQSEGADPADIERRALRELRKHLLWYTRGRRGGVRFRREADALCTAADVRRLIDLHFPPEGDGFAVDPALADDESSPAE